MLLGRVDKEGIDLKVDSLGFLGVRGDDWEVNIVIIEIVRGHIISGWVDPYWTIQYI